MSYKRKCQETDLAVGSVPTLFCLGIQPNRLNVHARSARVGYQHGLPACRILFLASEEGCQPAFRIVGLPSVPQDLGPKPSACLGK
jgi:hypothetical protein